MDPLYLYLCRMKDEIIIPVLKIEDVVTATKRRETYSLKRDIQAREFNEAIAVRLAKEEDKADSLDKEKKD
jgi:hypothetical protein